MSKRRTDANYLPYDFLEPRADLLCASCGNPGAVMGLGGFDDNDQKIPACDGCITSLDADTFEANIRAWCKENGRPYRAPPWKT